MADPAQIERAKMLLANRDVVIYIGGCGCCGSPSVYLGIEGEPIIFDENNKDDPKMHMRAVENASLDNSGFSST